MPSIDTILVKNSRNILPNSCILPLLEIKWYEYTLPPIIRPQRFRHFCRQIVPVYAVCGLNRHLFPLGNMDHPCPRKAQDVFSGRNSHYPWIRCLTCCGLSDGEISVFARNPSKYPPSSD
jgi:hypothetical protein